MKALRLPLFLAATLLLTACDSSSQPVVKLTKENVGKIHDGMTIDEVKAILGPPTETKTGNIPTPPGITVSGITHVYRNGETLLSITFVDGKVAVMETNMP